ncbi:protein-glutamine gamma-glutamyltransferase [Bacillus sp. V3B]|uniref:protein-glutamine gamma-glutamyltransferase n=1 Tax=Bacillus sp. V3B TaxID=2804915 RepID=UPI00210CE896|nr:protein-glutamine gamma-glutamyltransferase [Bacillus sp. V3B]MCQ6274196.1 protein-glutamine gamma-glutamyltransferase [Bacillus sp. V3B]
MTIFVSYEQKPDILRFNGLQRDIYLALERSSSLYQYDTVHQLLFEIVLRGNIIKAAKMLHESQATFAPFTTSRFNPLKWRKTKYGYLQNPNVLPSEAIRDVFQNSREYAFECTTAIVLIFYKAVLDSISITHFNTLFQDLLVWDWKHDQDLGIIAERGRDFIPGDVVYFANPEYDHPVWSGENAVYLGKGLYFGHGIGIKTAEGMVNDLNTLRKKDATISAYLISQHTRLNVKYLAQFSKRLLF